MNNWNNSRMGGEIVSYSKRLNCGGKDFAVHRYL